MGNAISSSQGGLRTQPSAEPLLAGPAMQMAHTPGGQQPENIQTGATNNAGTTPQINTGTGDPDHGNGAQRDPGTNIEFLHSRNFYIGAAALLAANLALLAALAYLIICIDEYQHHRLIQTLVAWLGIWFGVALIGGLIIWWAFKRIATLQAEPTRANRVRRLGARWLPAGSIIGTELAAIIAIVGYFYGSATDQYFRLIWESESNISPWALAPGFVILGDYHDATSATFTEGWSSCTFPAYESSCSTHFSERPTKWTEDSPYGAIAYYTLNASNAINFTHPGDQLKLQTNVQCTSHPAYKRPRLHTNSTVGDSKELSDQYNTTAPQNPSLYTIMYDPRLTNEQFQTAIRCGIIGWTEQPALGSSTYTIDQITQTSDVLGKLTDGILDTTCKKLARTLYTLDDGYMTYRYHLTSSGTSYAYVCDTNGTSQSKAACVAQVIIRYGSFSTIKLTSKHGKEVKEIILDMGSIVGAVQYAAWFFTIFQ
ncbi:hypothetical protein LTR15_012349 [Elasticomyces elasticus]|nr:hypothetical protein LTR15_012349 [Elasticomyces elasticus]